jgi:hypothetical protein
MAITRLDYELQLSKANALYKIVNDLGQQYDDFYDTFTVGHTTGGIHSDELLPKGAGKVEHTLGVTSLRYSSGIVDSLVVGSGSGVVQIDLTDGTSDLNAIHVDVVIHSDDPGYGWTYQVVSTSRIKILTFDVASPNATAVDFSFAVWTDGDPEESDATPNPLVKRNHVSVTSDSPTVIEDLNEFIDQHQQYYDAFSAKHDANGTHNDDVLPRGGGSVLYTDSTFDAVTFGSIMSIEDMRTGETRITLNQLPKDRKSLHVHVTCDYLSSDYYSASVKINAFNMITVYTRSVSNDALANVGFRFSVWYAYE